LQSRSSTSEENILSWYIIIHYHNISKDRLHSPVDPLFPIDIRWGSIANWNLVASID
jgi:hypothetical protein